MSKKDNPITIGLIGGTGLFQDFLAFSILRKAESVGQQLEVVILLAGATNEPPVDLLVLTTNMEAHEADLRNLLDDAANRFSSAPVFLICYDHQVRLLSQVGTQRLRGVATMVCPTSEMTTLVLSSLWTKDKYSLTARVKEILALASLGAIKQDDPISKLSKAEQRVIEYVRQGFRSNEIAKKIGCSAKTVEVHRYNILKKIGARNTIDLVNILRNHQVIVSGF